MERNECQKDPGCMCPGCRVWEWTRDGVQPSPVHPDRIAFACLTDRQVFGMARGSSTQRERDAALIELRYRARQ